METEQIWHKVRDFLPLFLSLCVVASLSMGRKMVWKIPDKIHFSWPFATSGYRFVSYADTLGCNVYPEVRCTSTININPGARAKRRLLPPWRIMYFLFTSISCQPRTERFTWTLAMKDRIHSSSAATMCALRSFYRSLSALLNCHVLGGQIDQV